MAIDFGNMDIKSVLENIQKTTNPMGFSGDDKRIEGEFKDIGGEDGEISKKEMTSYLTEAGLSEDEAKEVTDDIFGKNETLDYGQYREKEEMINRIIAE